MAKDPTLPGIYHATVIDHSRASSYIFAIRLPYRPLAAATREASWPARYGIRRSTVDLLGSGCHRAENPIGHPSLEDVL